MTGRTAARPVSLLRGYELRAPTDADLGAVGDLFRVWEAFEFQEADWTIEDTRDELTDVDLAKDAWLVTAPEGAVAGFLFLHASRPRRWWGFGCVHPDHRALGVGSALLERYDARARERLNALPPGEPVELSVGVSGRDRRGRSLVERSGFRWKRRFWDMSVTHDRRPEEAEWPVGIEVAPFVSSDARDVHEAAQEAFQDHFDFAPRPFEDWRRRWLEREGFDPSLWFVAKEETEIAGISLCKQRATSGWIDVLGVRRPWRRRGLGLALLQHSFLEFFDRGMRKVGLGVDSENPTGATALYERAGMEVVREFDMFAKQLPSR